MKAKVDNTWQISPFRHMLLMGAFVLNGNLVNTPQIQEERLNAKCNTGHISHNDEPQARQINFTQDSIEALHRRVLSGNMVIPEAVALAGATPL